MTNILKSLVILFEVTLTVFGIMLTFDSIVTGDTFQVIMNTFYVFFFVILIIIKNLLQLEEE